MQCSSPGQYASSTLTPFFSRATCRQSKSSTASLCSPGTKTIPGWSSDHSSLQEGTPQHRAQHHCISRVGSQHCKAWVGALGSLLHFSTYLSKHLPQTDFHA